MAENGEDLYVMNERYEVKEGPQQPRAVGCMIAISADGSGVGMQAQLTPDLRYDAATTDQGLHVQVLIDNAVTEDRLYDEAFIRSAEVDAFEVVTLEQRTFVMRHWGGSACESFFEEETK